MIKIFKENYNRSEFYSIMGKYFAEPIYKKELPYIANRDNTVWYVDVDEYNNVLAFSCYEECKSIEFKTTYFEKDNIDSLEKIIDLQLKHLVDKNINTANSNIEIINVFKKYGFNEYKKTTNYTFLRREVKNDR